MNLQILILTMTCKKFQPMTQFSIQYSEKQISQVWTTASESIARSYWYFGENKGKM